MLLMCTVVLDGRLIARGFQMTARLVRPVLLFIAFSLLGLSITASPSDARKPIAQFPPGVSTDGAFQVGTYTFVQRQLQRADAGSRRADVVIDRIDPGPHHRVQRVARRKSRGNEIPRVQWFG